MPKKTARTTSDQKGQADSPGGQANGLSVLVYDDKEAYRKLVRSMLAQSTETQFKLREAGDSEQMKAELVDHQPDVIVLDLDLKGKSGMDWLEEIQERKIAPVVIITGHGNEQIAVEAMKRGAFDYIAKAYLTYNQLTKSLLNAHEKWLLLNEKEALQKRLAHMAMYDALTDILSRRAIMEQIESEAQRTIRYDRDLSILMIDIDHFKIVNDTYGHVFGDAVLREVAQSLYKTIRRSDFIGRYGGEEFLVVLPETSLDQAVILGDKLRIQVAATTVKSNGTVLKDTTVSIGAAAHDNDKSIEDFISRTDYWLYEAKKHGRNQVQPTGGGGG